MTNPLSSGDGTRPSTDGGVDNMGGAGRLPGVNKDGAPPKERMSDNRKDAAAAEKDDSAAFGLTQEGKDETPNMEKPRFSDGKG